MDSKVERTIFETSEAGSASSHSQNQRIMKACTIIAETLGMIAHENGKNRVPAQDSSWFPMIEGRQIGQTPAGEPSTVEILDAWLKGWDKAKNIKMRELFPEVYASK